MSGEPPLQFNLTLLKNKAKTLDHDIKIGLIHKKDEMIQSIRLNPYPKYDVK